VTKQSIRVLVVERNAGFLQPKAFGVGHASDADQHDIGFDRLRSAAGRRLNLDAERLARGVDGGNFGRQLEDKTLLFQEALELLGDLAIHPR